MRIVVAVGGNAIVKAGQAGTWEEQLANVQEIAAAVLALREQGHEVVLTHGNGPQVGALLLQQALGEGEAAPLPLDALIAATQGEIGYLLESAFAAVDPAVPVAVLLTRVLVDADDEAFANPTKPVGPFYSEEEAKRRAESLGWDVAPDAGRGWRRVVPSPQPLEVLGREHAVALLERGTVVISCGGGGIPVARRGDEVVGVAGVIDKDRCSERLACGIGADVLVLLTGVLARVAGLRYPLGARGRPADGDRRRCAACSEGEFPPGQHGAEGRVRGPVRAGVRRPRAGDQRRPARRRRRAATTGPGSCPTPWRIGRWRRELAGRGRPQPLRRQRPADEDRQGPARRWTASRAPRWRWARRPTSRRSRRSASAATPVRATWCSPSTAPAEALDGGRARAAPRRPPGRRPARRPTPPRSLVAAARQLPGANVALISVPGEYAALEAHRALTAGLHVFLFSDHVERRGRGRAQAARRRTSGCSSWARAAAPRCSGRPGLGFANVVRPGTGRHRRRRRHRRAGGRDPARRRGRRRLADHRRRRARPLGRGRRHHVPRGHAGAGARTTGPTRCCSSPSRRRARWSSGSATWTRRASASSPRSSDGRAATPRSRSTRRSRPASTPPRAATPPDLAELEAQVDERRSGGRLLGLFSGGSLAHEAVTILEPALGDIGGNAGHGGDGGHAIFDLGEEEYTQGRPHPMIDLDVRLEMLERAAGEDGLGCVLLDVVVGHGSHADPAGGLAPALGRARRAPAGHRARLRDRRRPAGQRAPGGHAARRPA